MHDIGPLPQSDDNAELQRRSLKALNALLEEQDTILFRDERKDDYGVDGAFELKLGGRMTNFRGQVQMKATASAEPNNDGSISLDIRSANLNYVLNGPSPIYILFDATRKEFRYVWAQDEARRLEAANPAWKEQATVTVRFTQRLTSETLTTIAERVFREGRLQRQIHDSLARATTDEPLIVRIDASSLKITDPLRARDVLLASGLAIAAAGYPKEVLQLMQLLDPVVMDLPRLQLTAGYAEYLLGKHYSALAHIRQAIARITGLSVRDRTFLNRLKDACELRVGIISAATYQQRMGERAQALIGLESLEAQQDALYREYLDERDFDARASLAERLRRITSQILSHSEANDAIRLGARLALLFVEGTEASLAATRERTLARVRPLLFPGRRTELLPSVQRGRSRLSDWEASAEQALKDADEIANPILIAEALTSVLLFRIGKLFDERLEALSLGAAFEVPEPIKSKVREDIETALAINEFNGTVEGRLRLKKLQADFLEIVGDFAGAKDVAARIYPEAEAMGFADIAERANELLQDRTLLMQFERELARLKQTDQDVEFAAYSDAELQRFADTVLQSIGSPPARAKVINEYCYSLREVARERCHWCRYLEMKEELAQTTDPATAFNVLPNRSCVCAKFDYKTEIITADAQALIGTFKQLYCASCPARSPKQP